MPVRILDTECYTMLEMAQKFNRRKDTFTRTYYEVKGLKWFKMNGEIFFPIRAYNEFRLKITGVPKDEEREK